MSKNFLGKSVTLLAIFFLKWSQMTRNIEK